jgi:tape measure domain-containing protein
VSVVANVAINVDSRNAVSKLREVQAQSKQTERAFGGIAAAATKLATAFGAIQAARFVFAKTAELESQSRSLAILAGSAQKAGQIIKELQDLGAVTPFTSTELIDSAKRLQAFGVEADKVVETTRRLADASGATGAELSGLVTAYGQVQAKGRLQGEELLQFQERGIALQEELRKMYGMTGEEFQKALSKGQVSAKAVEVALANLTSTGGKYANGAIAQSDTLNGRLSTLQDGVDALARRIGQVLTPALKAIFNQAIAVVDAINAALAAGRGGGFTRNVAGAKQFLNIGATSQAVDNIAKGVGQVSSQKNKSGIQQNLQALQQYQRLLQSIDADDPNADRAVQLQGKILTKINQNLATQKQLQSGAKQVDKLFTPPLLGAPPAGGGGGGGAGKGAGKGKDDAARIAEQIRASKLRLTLAQDIFAIEGRLQQAQLEGNEQLVLARNAQKELAQIASQRADIIADKEIPALAKKNVLNKLAIDAATVSGKLGFDLAKIEQDRIKSFDEIIAGVTNQIAVEEQLTEKSRAEVLLKQEIAKLQKDGVVITDEQVNAYKKANAALDETKAKVAAIKQQQEMLDGLYAGIANTIANGVGGAIDALSSGVDNLGETLQSLAADILKAVGKMLIFYALAQAFGALGGNDGVGVFSFLAKAFGGGRESGGPVAPNTNYIVGENGPELLSMGGSGGKVYSNNDSKMQSAMSRYSRGARGEGVIAGSGGGTEGESAAAAGPMVVDVRYSVERINDVEYVTASQFQAGMQQAAQQGAQQGEQRTLRKLQMSNSTRRRVGV